MEFKGRKFTTWELNSDPLTLTEEDYKRVSAQSGYYYHAAVYKLGGYEYNFRPMLKKYWFKNNSNITEAYARNITDLKRVIRAHYGSISRNFKAVEVK